MGEVIDLGKAKRAKAELDKTLQDHGVTMTVESPAKTKATRKPKGKPPAPAPPPPPPPRIINVATRDEIRAEKCRRSLAYFMREAWIIPEPSAAYVDNWHIGAMAEHLEAVTAGEIRRLIVNIPPGEMKSLATAVFWPAWEWMTAPEGRWMTMAYAQNLSRRDSIRTRRIIQSVPARDPLPEDSLFRRLGYRGVLGLLGKDWELTGDVNAVDRFENTERGYRIASSFGGTATGERADRVVIDDPHSAAEARSDTERKNGLTWYDDTMPTRINHPTRSTIVVIMQRLHEKDLTGHLLGKGGWEHLCLPGMYERNHPQAWIKDPRTKDGESLDKVRLSPTRLAELAKDLGSYGFAGQIQQRPAPAKGGILKDAWFRRYRKLNPGRLEIIESWDCAFKKTDESDFVVGQAWGRIGPDAFLLGQIRARMDFPQTKVAVRTLRAWVLQHYPIIASHVTLIEDKANGSAVISELQHEIGSLVAVEPPGGKIARAYAVSPRIEAGNVHIPATDFIPCPVAPPADPDHPEIEPPEWEPTSVDDYLGETRSFPNGANDDQVDATTQAIWRVASTGSATMPDDDDNEPVEEDTITGDLLDREF